MIIIYCPNPLCSKKIKSHSKLRCCDTCGSNLSIQKRYLLINKIGQGGFGTTFIGVDLKKSEDPFCLIKQLCINDKDANAVQMALTLFSREAKTLSEINHTQIPRLYNYFSENGQFYLVEELIRGNNLEKQVKENGIFSETEVKYFLSEMLNILEYIHSKNIIHRDLKPSNIMRRKKDGKFILIDFGAVKYEVNTQLTQTYCQNALTNFSIATKGFTPPEQIIMRPVYASDIYALGATCVYLITGKYPKSFQYNSTTGVLLWAQEASISNSLTKILNKMQEIDLGKRYQTVKEVIKDLDKIQRFALLAKIRPKIQLTHETFVKNYSRGQKDFNQHNLSKMNLANKKLKRCSFVQSDLIGVNLQGANLYKANFSKANLAQAILHKAYLRRAHLYKAKLKNADLRGANLRHANLEDANLEDANFYGADLTHAKVNEKQLKSAKTNWLTIYPDGKRRWRSEKKPDFYSSLEFFTILNFLLRWGDKTTDNS